ncbi:MAG TPA: recombinase family protein, partial [Microlunatus sp.]
MHSQRQFGDPDHPLVVARNLLRVIARDLPHFPRLRRPTVQPARCTPAQLHAGHEKHRRQPSAARIDDPCAAVHHTGHQRVWPMDRRVPDESTVRAPPEAPPANYRRHAPATHRPTSQSCLKRDSCTQLRHEIPRLRYIPRVKIGYGRVSTRDQHPEAQADALTAAGCRPLYIDKASGKLAKRPQLDEALQA